MRDTNRPTGDGPAPADPSVDTPPRHRFSTPVATEPGSVHVIVGSERTRIILAGDIDADVAADLQDATTEAERAGLPIEVDGHHVTFMDSSGIAFLARLSTRTPWRIRLIRVSPTVRFLLQVTRIGDLLEIVDEDPGSDMTFPDGTSPTLS